MRQETAAHVVRSFTYIFKGKPYVGSRKIHNIPGKHYRQLVLRHNNGEQTQVALTAIDDRDLITFNAFSGEVIFTPAHLVKWEWIKGCATQYHEWAARELAEKAKAEYLDARPEGCYFYVLHARPGHKGRKIAQM